MYFDTYEEVDATGQRRLCTSRFRDIPALAEGSTIDTDSPLWYPAWLGDPQAWPDGISTHGRPSLPPNSAMRSRATLYCVPIPGEAEWAREIYGQCARWRWSATCPLARPPLLCLIHGVRGSSCSICSRAPAGPRRAANPVRRAFRKALQL